MRLIKLKYFSGSFSLNPEFSQRLAQLFA